MRGKGVKQYTADRVVGITPAYAGKSSPAAVKVIFGQDHPRLCGEKFGMVTKIILSSGSPPPMRGKAIFQCSHLFALLGSPPPMRGKVALCNRHSVDQGITPAYAGKSSGNRAFIRIQ